MPELAITKIDDALFHQSWLGDEAWQMAAALKPGEMLEVTSLLDGRKAASANASIRWGLNRRKLKHLTIRRIKERVFIIYFSEQRDGAG